MRVALITGAARGIGRAIAEDLARDHAIAITYRTSRAEADDLAARLDALAVQADFRDPEAPAAAVAAVAARYGRIDALVNNAGLAAPSPLSGGGAGIEADILRVNGLAPLTLTRAVLPHMAAGGAILNVSSLNARLPPPADFAAYAASKAMLEGLTRALAKELGPQGIRVNALAPGPFEVADAPRGPEITARILARTPLGRVGRPEDAAQAARFLLSDAAGFVTGVTLDVGGGFGL